MEKAESGEQKNNKGSLRQSARTLHFAPAGEAYAIFFGSPTRLRTGSTITVVPFGPYFVPARTAGRRKMTAIYCPILSEA